MKKLLAALVILFGFVLNPVTAQNKDCTEAGCHQGLVSLKVVHAPVNDDCSSCHLQSKNNHPNEGEKEFVLVSRVPELCSSCHDLELDDAGFVHGPVSSGECLDCHNVHGSKTAKLLKKERLCDTCHDLELTGKKVHGPVAGFMCSACHAPHQSRNKYLLIRDGLDLCVFCHTDKMEREGVQSMHTPFEEDCHQCHQPHASSVKYMLDIDVPELCYNCHKTVEVDLSKKSEVHGPFQKGGKCYVCHNAHTSQYNALLKDREEKLCFTCHNQKIRRDGRVIKAIEQRVLHSEYVHAPVKNEGCSVCHAAHTPDNYFLLSAAFPKGTYSNGKIENFAHCFDCHNPELMEQAETTTATAFRNGKQNLHFVHVNREKARNCTTCHDIHGSDYPFIIAEKVLFGNWEMPMNFKKTDAGGSCLTGCHEELNYSR